RCFLPPRELALFRGAALRRLRSRIPGAVPDHLLVQFATRGVRELPRLRPHDRDRLWPGDPRRNPLFAWRGDQAVADEVLCRVPTGHGEVREAPWHPSRYPVAGANGGSPALGNRGRRSLVAQGVVWSQAILCLAGDARLQDARTGAAVTLSSL